MVLKKIACFKFRVTRELAIITRQFPTLLNVQYTLLWSAYALMRILFLPRPNNLFISFPSNCELQHDYLTFRTSVYLLFLPLNIFFLNFSI